MRVLSFGAGVQSTALLAAAARGVIAPVDMALFADTGAEPAQVYDWLEFVRAQFPQVPVEVINGGNIEEDTLRGDGSRFASAPFYITGSARGGMLRRQCTSDYKIRPIRRRLAEFKEKGRVIDVLMGISTDEIQRAKDSGVQWLRHRFPLLWPELEAHCGGQLGWNRQRCIEYVEETVGRTPPKSACYFCPYHDSATWARMKKEDPETFARAIAFDERIRRMRHDVLKGEMFLHRSLKPLAEVDFENGPQDPNQLTFVDECDGMCGL